MSTRTPDLIRCKSVIARAARPRPGKNFAPFSPTEAGRALEPVLLQIMQWGHKYLGGGTFEPKHISTNERTGGRTNLLLMGAT